ncbi:MAG: biotin-dependent carboxyltransferase family protein [Thermoanaerobaculaceae bacterium]|nr:biotin-dependent carboxyltransferase family protein [Thermoanaerobaculaceae bacterium]
MTDLLVHRPGLLTTVQDLGRPGLGRFGVSPSGAMDPFALRIANRLLGNADDAPALEVTGVGAEIEFLGAAAFALAGANLGATLDGVPLEPWTTQFARAGAVLRFGRRQQGARCYLAFPGGLAVPKVLGSAATDLDAGIGGVAGRALAAGDRLSVAGGSNATARRARLSVRRAYAPPFELRFVPKAGRAAAAARALEAASYRLSPHANRTGYRFQGPPLPVSPRADAFSEPVPPGAIQVPPDGQPILLMADRPTVGGYEVVGCVIAADIPKAAQLWPGHGVRFRAVSAATARQAHRELEALLATAVLP